MVKCSYAMKHDPTPWRNSADPVRARALRAVACTRALGLHFYGHFIGVTGRPPADGHARLQAAAEPPCPGSHAISPLALATLADLTLGAAIRSRVAPGARLATVTLALQHIRAPVQGPLVADAQALLVADGHGLAHCQIEAGGALVGQAQGWFSALPTPPGTSLGLMPWEVERPPPVPAVAEADLTEAEAAAVRAAEQAGARAARAGTAISQKLLPFRWEPGADGRSRGVLAIGPELGNRVGHVQGGALYAAAADAALRAAGAPDPALADGHLQFLRPGDGSSLVAEGAILRQGRRVTFAEARILVDGTLAAAGLFTFRQ